MPARAPGRHALALFGYVCVAVAFAWPLPLQMGTAVLGPVGGDTGVYIWNLWVFRHEVLAHHQLPFQTLEILALAQPVPLTLHNYTTFANIVAFPLLGILGTVTTFNLLVLGGLVTSAYAAFLLARFLTGDDVAAWVGGLVFGFSPFMIARAAGHFSLVLAAPLPIFCYLLHRLARTPTFGLASAAGVVVAWAYLCDPYYAVYCLVIALFMTAYMAASVEWRTTIARMRVRVGLLDLALLCLAGLIVGILVRGGGRVEFWGVRVSMTQLQNPVLAFTVLFAVRVWRALRPYLSWHFIVPTGFARALTVGALTCAALLVPVLSIGSSLAANVMGPRVFWRSSSPGVDLLAFMLPNPFNPAFQSFGVEWLSMRPNGLVENVASVPILALLVIGLAVWRGARLPRGCVAFTGVAAVLALGPFVRIAGFETHIPTPWAILRYLPIVGAARVPTRFTVLVMLGVAVLTAAALRHLRATAKRSTLLSACVAVALCLELLPAPRPLFSAEVPSVNRIIRADPRPLRVLNLPFGVRDGLVARGGSSAAFQYYQTVHEKPIVGGYLSRLPRHGVARYRRNHVLRALLRLSEGRTQTPEEIARALESVPRFVPPLNVGWVVVNQRRTSPELLDFAQRAFDLTLVAVEGGYALYRTPAAAPLTDR